MNTSDTKKTAERVLKVLGRMADRMVQTRLPKLDQTKRATRERITDTLRGLGFVTHEDLAKLEARISALETLGTSATIEPASVTSRKPDPRPTATA